MVEISIICLIYKSKKLAQAVYDSIQKYTPKLKDGSAEFFFVANDPTQELVDYLRKTKIPHFININEHLSRDELFKLGFGAPEYMRRVYQGYNRGILEAKGQRIVLINSDNFFSQDWLENLLKYSDYKKVVCSTLVEPGQDKFGVFPSAIEKNFGRTLTDFKEHDFQKYVAKISRTGFFSGGAYMPCLVYRDLAIMAGLYPGGNIAGESFNKIKRYGDEFFYDRLNSFGVEHITAKDSIVYHLKEGEKSEEINEELYKTKAIKPKTFDNCLVVKPRNLINYLKPETDHQNILDALANKVTVLILNPNNKTDLKNQIKTINNFIFKDVETVVISDKKMLPQDFNCKIKFIYCPKAKIDIEIRKLFYNMYGELLLVINPKCNYPADLFDRIEDTSSIYYFGGSDTKELVDYVGYFLFPRKLLVKHVSTFLDPIVIREHSFANEFVKFDIKDVSARESQTDLVELTSINKRFFNITKRLIKKLQKDGLPGLIRTVYWRLKND